MNGRLTPNAAHSPRPACATDDRSSWSGTTTCGHDTWPWSSPVGGDIALGDEAGAKDATFNDAAWRKLALPHDWSIGLDPAEGPHTGAGTGFLPGDRDQIYELPKDDLYLVGTSEVPLAGLHADEIIDAERLPIRYSGLSTCFRREAGAAGATTILGDWGFSSDERPHGDRLGRVASHRPTFTVYVDRPRKVAQVWPLGDEPPIEESRQPLTQLIFAELSKQERHLGLLGRQTPAHAQRALERIQPGETEKRRTIRRQHALVSLLAQRAHG